jgi:hypothetical protein
MEYRATHGFVDRGQRPRARQQIMTDMHREIWIHTDERQPPRQCLFEHGTVLLWLFGPVIQKTGAGDSVSRLEAVHQARYGIEEGAVAHARANSIDASVTLRGNPGERDIA